MSEHPNPAVTDQNATPAQLLARAANDYATQQAANRKKAEQGGTEDRQGILPGGGN
ncbi:hypothetical protein [Streptomyces sp. NPDC050121]|uniref:hypothetical protein n=1 Tax=Streptomyces sp. NPDC050121 TaxID=3365601 RepID=UPI0037986693